MAISEAYLILQSISLFSKTLASRQVTSLGPTIKFLGLFLSY